MGEARLRNAAIDGARKREGTVRNGDAHGGEFRAQPGGSSIGGTVVGDDDFGGEAVEFALDARKLRGKQIAAVARRDDDGDARLGGLRGRRGARGTARAQGSREARAPVIK